MTKQELYCLGIHFKCLYEQRINKRPFDIAEPCHICKYNKVCQCKCWAKMQDTLSRETGIKINHFVSQ